MAVAAALVVAGVPAVVWVATGVTEVGVTVAGTGVNVFAGVLTTGL